MFARISFDDKQYVTNEEFQEVEVFLSDIIEYEKLYVKVDGENDDDPTEFYSWKYTLDPLELDKDKDKILVRETNKVKLKTTKEYITSLDAFLNKFPAIKIKVRGIHQGSSEVNLFSNVISQMLTIENKLENALKSFDQSVEFNQKCDVHVSNLGLLHINQLGYAVDKCTEELQDILNKGWRLIACCVQPDQRRPDYILGRYNPNEDAVKCINF